MDKRFVQAQRSALGAVADPSLSCRMVGNCLLTRFNDRFTGLPHWFEMACLLTPLVFILLCWAMVRFIFRDIPWRIMMQLEVILPLIAYAGCVGLVCLRHAQRTPGPF
jgi:uncharacterized membrane protein YhdT